MQEIINKERINSIIDETETFIFDCDGVLWYGNKQLEGAVKFVNELKRREKNVYFVTNNNTHTNKYLLEKFKRMGFDNIEENCIFSPARTAALWVKKFVPPSKGRVYVMGNPAMETELELAGVRNHFGVGRDDELAEVADPQGVEQTTKIKLESDVAAVLVGFDGHFNHTKLVKAASYLRDPQCRFVATNRDERFALPHHPHVVIGTGSLVAAVETASLREVEVLTGKPGQFMFECFSEQSGVKGDKCLMVGDNLNTDVKFGRNNGMRTLLVLSGVTSRQKLIDHPDEGKPDYFAEGLELWSELLKL